MIGIGINHWRRIIVVVIIAATTGLRPVATIGTAVLVILNIPAVSRSHALQHVTVLIETGEIPEWVAASWNTFFSVMGT